MRPLRAFLADSGGTSAVEFALVLPVFLLTFFAMIDVGRFFWSVNQAEKATQVGARWAAATDMVPSALSSYSFAVTCAIPQGTPVPASAFPGISCTGNGTTAICTYTASSSCSTAPANTANNAAFNRIVNRMQTIDGSIAPTNVVVDYSNSGLGFAGDPNGPDVAPIITVRLQNLRFKPIMLSLFNRTVLLPSARYSIPMEDGQGTTANY